MLIEICKVWVGSFVGRDLKLAICAGHRCIMNKVFLLIGRSWIPPGQWSGIQNDKYHGPHIVVNPKWYLTWKACPSSINLKNERHGTVSALWAPQSKEVQDSAVQLLPLSLSKKSRPRLSDQVMCFSQNRRMAYTTYYSWNVPKVGNPNYTASP